MTHTKNKAGFTVVETMIFLAVSGMIFVSTAGFIKGQISKKQDKEYFVELQQMVQNAVRDAENGYFPSDVSNTNPGTNSNPNYSIYLGRQILFCLQSDCGAANKYKIQLATWVLKVDGTYAIDGSPQYLNTPGNLKPIGFIDNVVKGVDKTGGFSVVFDNLFPTLEGAACDKNVFCLGVKNDSGQSVGIYRHTLQGISPSGLSDSAYAFDHPYKVCFEGKKRSSIAVDNKSRSLQFAYDDLDCGAL